MNLSSGGNNTVASGSGTTGNNLNITNNIVHSNKLAESRSSLTRDHILGMSELQLSPASSERIEKRLSTPQQSSSISMGSPSISSASSISKKSMQVSPIVERLNAVKNSAQTFNGDLMEDLTAKKEVEQTKVFELRDTVAKIEKDLTLEMRKRAESDKVLQTLCDNKINTVQDVIEKKMNEKFSQMQLVIDTLSKRVINLEKLLAEEKDYASKFSNTMKTGVIGQLEELRSMIEEERMTRLEKEAQLTRKINDEYFKVSQKLESEKKARELFITSTREDMERVEQAKAKIDQDFRTRIFDEVDNLREELKRETEQREIVDEQIVNSLDTIIKQVHDSLRMVTK
ncbi:hypothetical protein C9374_009962 [Naegleria lovaniensis]|uniref:SF-assemblin n=1 Tax=Naegleria lovaniensis TaxID=51637 RepID=A0AA88GHH2_NAELO|nr:uncharacterized protein C9374_009962 [Naegleria lovaniensis]KAG2375339.1 hypothetical protein C9374_009962 [Naegleria lovaniensis]